MNADQIEILGTLRARVKALMKKLEEEQRARKKFEKEKAEMLAVVNQQKHKIEELEYRYNNLKTARSLASENEEMHDAKIRVNRIVREIDKCIALLNR